MNRKDWKDKPVVSFGRVSSILFLWLPKDTKIRIFLKFHRTITTQIERIPPFEKGGPGGIYEAIHLKNPPQSPFSKGGSIIFIYGGIEFKKDTKIHRTGGHTNLKYQFFE